MAKIEFIERKFGDDVSVTDPEGLYLFKNNIGEVNVIAVGVAAMSWSYDQIQTAVRGHYGGNYVITGGGPLYGSVADDKPPSDMLSSPAKRFELLNRGFWSILLSDR